MKELIVAIFGLFIFSISSCDNDISSKDGKLISNTLCKNEKESTNTNETCVEYSYNEKNKILNLKHINTAFNCCPKALYAEVTIEDNIITIEESERTQECNCMCLYDMEIEVYKVENVIYSVKFKEPYVAEEYELVFDINLLEKPTGSFCLTRNKYPWTE